MTLEIRLFGDFALRQDGRLVAGLDSQRLQTLLAYLLLQRDAPVLRHYLAFLFWPDTSEAQARTNLRNLVHRLRQAWPEAGSYLAIKTKSLAWRPDAPLWLDVAQFEDHLRQAQAAAEPAAAQDHLRQAVELYRNDLLLSCHDDWIEPHRARLRRTFLQAMEQWAGLLQAAGDYPGAIRLLEQLSEGEPLEEGYFQRLIELHGLAGDRGAALRVYYRCATTLHRELGVAPGAATQAAYRRLLALDSQAAALPDAPAETTLVGRSVPWEQLRLAWQETAAGRRPPRLVLLSGEAGIGKTRLAEELSQWTQRQGAITAVAACYAAEAQIAFGPVTVWLRALSLAHLAPAWRAELARLLPELAGTGQPAAEGAGPVEGWQKNRLYQALALAILGQKQPICLRLEDVQWCDGETLAWLHYLLRADDKARVLLVATWRQEETRAEHPLPAALLAWREQGRLLQIELARLTAGETAELAAALAGQPVDTQLAEALYRHTEGNPLFLVETVRSNLGNIPDEALLPPKIQAVLQRRLAQLSPAARRLLDVAAVVGRSFTIDVLGGASGAGEDELFSALDELWQRRIVRDQAGDVYDFSHDKLRQVAYLDLSPARRRWLHGRVAQALQAQPAAASTSQAGRIAFHYEAAGQADQALAHHRLAANAAQRVYAFDEAAFHLQRAIALAEQAGLPAGERSQLHEHLGDIHSLAGQHPEALRQYQAALAGAGNSLQGAALTGRMGGAWLAQYELQQAWSSYEAALALLPAPAEFEAAHWPVWLDLRLKQLDVLYYAADLGRMPAMLEELRPPLEQHGDLRQRIQFYQLCAQLESRQTRFCHSAQGVAYARAACELAEQTRDAALIHSARFGLGFMLLWQEEPDIAEAIGALEQAVAGSEATGNTPLLARSLAYLAIAHRLRGDEAAVRALLPRCLAAAEGEDNTLYRGVARANRAWLAARAGDWLQATADARFALAQWRKLVYPFHWLACWPYLAAAVAGEDVKTAAVQAQAMLAPEQQPPPAAVAAALKAAVARPALPRFEDALALAGQSGFL
jgi:DNA-binding SARP family transcriptional activator